MSWDVMIFNTCGKTPPPVEELEEGDYVPLGSADEVRQQISSHLIAVDWSDPTWGIYEGNGFSIEFNIGDDETIDSLMLHIRGGGDPISTISQFARPLGWSALDISTSEFIGFDNPSQEGWEDFQTFRDKVVERFLDENQSSEPGT